MSWHYLQEQEEASWGESSLAGAPSALSRLMPTVAPVSSPGNATGCSLDSQSGTISERSMVVLGEGMSMSFPVDSLARTSAQPDHARESTANGADSGWRWPVSFVKYDRDTSSWRTRQTSLLSGLDEFSGTWPRWGSMRDGECSALVVSELRTIESACGLLPTPLASDGGNGTRQRGRRSRGGQRLSLAMLPTPRASEAGRGGMRTSEMNRFSPCLSALMQSAVMLPTPTTAGNENSRSMLKLAAHRRLANLMGRILPTPTARLYGSNCGGAAGRIGKNRPSLESMTGGPWIPFREWMMGWPIGWTDLRPLGTDRFQEWRDWHGRRSVPEENEP